MPRKGEIRVEVVRADLKLVLPWIRAEISSALKRPLTIVASKDTRDRHVENLMALERILARSSNRRRSKDRFNINIPKLIVESFLTSIEGERIRIHLFSQSYSMALYARTNRFERLIYSMQKAASRKVGRNPLGVADRRKRLATPTPSVYVGERQKKRVRRADRRNEVQKKWSKGLRERGETILTSTQPFPKI